MEVTQTQGDKPDLVNDFWALYKLNPLKSQYIHIYETISPFPLKQVDNKPIDANKNPQPLKEEIPRLKPAEKRRTSKVRRLKREPV